MSRRRRKRRRRKSAQIGCLSALLAMVNKRWALRQLAEKQSLVELLALSPREFEWRMAQMIAVGGTKVQVCQTGPDGGVDIRGQRLDGRRFIVQCKRYRPGNKVSVKAVRELRGVMAQEQAAYMVFITTSTFTRPARSFAESEPGLMYLLDGERLGQILAAQKLARTTSQNPHQISGGLLVAFGILGCSLGIFLGTVILVMVQMLI